MARTRVLSDRDEEKRGVATSAPSLVRRETTVSQSEVQIWVARGQSLVVRFPVDVRNAIDTRAYLTDRLDAHARQFGNHRHAHRHRQPNRKRLPWKLYPYEG